MGSAVSSHGGNGEPSGATRLAAAPRNGIIIPSSTRASAQVSARLPTSSSLSSATSPVVGAVTSSDTQRPPSRATLREPTDLARGPQRGPGYLTCAEAVSRSAASPRQSSSPPRRRATRTSRARATSSTHSV